jgi:hypothetical protein
MRLITGLGLDAQAAEKSAENEASKLHFQMMSVHGVVQALGQQAADLPLLLNASEVRCFEREGQPAALQLSAFPAPEETGVRYFRGSIPKTQVRANCCALQHQAGDTFCFMHLYPNIVVHRGSRAADHLVQPALVHALCRQSQPGTMLPAAGATGAT